MRTFLAQAFLAFILSVILGSPLNAAPIFGGSTDAETGEEIGLCLGDKENLPPECEGVNCENPEFAQDPRCLSEAQIGTELAEESLDSTGITHTDSVIDLVFKFINFFLPYLALAAFLAFVVAGVMYVTAFQNEEQTTKAKQMMMWAVIGIVIVIASYTIVQFFTGGLLGRL